MSQVEGQASKPQRLTGRDTASIDEKGRLALGAKNRDRLGPNFVLSKGKNGCLCIYPEPRWRVIEEAFEQFPPHSDAYEQYTRVIGPNIAADMNCDGQGRIVIPPYLRNASGLEGNILILGCIDRIELWPEHEYAMFEKDPENYGDENRAMFRRLYMELKLA